MKSSLGIFKYLRGTHGPSKPVTSIFFCFRYESQLPIPQPKSAAVDIGGSFLIYYQGLFLRYISSWHALICKNHHHIFLSFVLQISIEFFNINKF